HLACIASLMLLVLMGVRTRPIAAGAAQSAREADGPRLLRGAPDLHFHVDPWGPGATSGQADIATIRVARERGMRGLLLKDHNEPTAPLAYLLRREMPNFELYGGLVLNLPNG